MPPRAFPILFCFLALPACQKTRQPVTVFVAASMARALGELAEEVERDHQRLDVRLEISGSQTACRKVAELNRRADLVAAADTEVIRRILVPEWAPRVIDLATNEVVLAHLEHSKHTGEISEDNWREVLLRPGVRLGMVDPDLAPIGYRTLLVWELADGAQTGLAKKLAAAVPAARRVPHEGELLARLQSRALDYAFVYRSTAEDHNLKLVALPDAYNLGSPDMAAAYGKARVSVRMRSSGPPVQVPGAPIMYGAAIPKDAPNRAGARLAEQGRRVLLRRGFRPLGAGGPR